MSSLSALERINFAYRLQERNPELSYCILEERHKIGGTWSLFKYPGQLKSVEALLQKPPLTLKPFRRPICSPSGSHGGHGQRSTRSRTAH